MDTWESGQRRKAIRASLKGYTTQEHAAALDRLAVDLKGAHTPGPWALGLSAAGDAYIVRFSNESGATNRVFVHGASPVFGGVPEANARLIAAAPDLAEACRALLMDLTTDAARRALCGAYGEKAWTDRIGMARAALAKAGL